MAGWAKCWGRALVPDARFFCATDAERASVGSGEICGRISIWRAVEQRRVATHAPGAKGTTRGNSIHYHYKIS